MVWFKVDDGFATHPKVVQAGNAACGLWVRAGSWSAQQLTDGYIPSSMIAVLGGRKAEAKRLVEVGLWLEESDGYQFHQWNEEGRQPTRNKVELDRAEDRKRKAEARAAKAAKNGQVQ